MLNFNEDGQAFLFDLDSWFGRTSQAHSQAELRKEKTSGSSLRRLRELVGTPYLFIDLTPGHGDLLGEPYWELRSPWRGDVLMHNTGVSPRDAIASSLSQILEATVPPKYYLTHRACLGILRRAWTRGKELPNKLEQALKIQAGLTPADEVCMEQVLLSSYEHKFSSDEENADVLAFTANQRDEVRDLHDVAGVLGAQPGMKQQTLVAAGFCAGASPTAGSIGFQEEVSPTLKARESGTNMVPSILCLNDQGGSVMECSEDIVGTLRAQDHGHQPVVLGSQQGNADIGIGICSTITTAAGMSGNNQPVLFENQGMDSRYAGPSDVCPTMTARYGTGGNNTPLIGKPEIYCITGNAIDRQPHNGGNGIGFQENLSYTLTATDHHAVFSRQRVDIFRDNDVVSTQSARQHKDATDLVLDAADAFGASLSEVNPIQIHMLLRRLIPVECERLQGFPDYWTDIPKAPDSARYKALGNSVAVPCVEFIMKGLADELRGN